MALNDLSRRVVTTYEADTSGHAAALESLKGKTEEAGGGFVEMAKHANESLNEMVEGLGKFNQAFEGVKKIIEVGAEGLKTYGEELRLTAAAGSTDIEQLSEAFSGLRTEHELLSFAAKAQHGILKLTQEQMNQVGEAVTSLTRQGFDQAEAFDKLTDAVVGLKTKGLDKLGISVQKGATDAETLDNVMQALNKTIEKGKDLASTEADDVQRLSTKWANAKEAVLGYIGASLSVSGIKQGKGVVFDTANVLSFGRVANSLENKWRREMEGADIGAFLDQSKIDAGVTADQKEINPWDANGGGNSVDVGKLLTFADGLDAKLKAYESSLKAGTETAKRIAEERKKLANAIAKTTTDELVKTLEEEADQPYKEGELALKGQQASLLETKKHLDELFAKAKPELDGLQKSLVANDKQQDKFLEKTFGKVGDFDIYKEAFKGLEQGVTGALNAWISGSDSAGQAFKKFVSTAVSSIATQMGVEALKEGAYAIASLAMQQYDKAALHATAAAEFGAGAAVAAVAAKELGGNGGSGGSGKGGGPAPSGGGGGGGGSGGGGSQGPIIVIGDSFANESARMKQQKAQQLVNRALGAQGGAVNS